MQSCLGGGDLDGDVYNVTLLKDLHPSQTIPPAPYEPAPKKLLERPSTMDDVADFVADYINSDVSVAICVGENFLTDTHRSWAWWRLVG